MPLENLSIYIVSSSSGSRAKLREVLINSIYKAQVEHGQSLEELKTHLIRETLSASIVFIMSSAGRENISRFLVEVRNVKKLPAFLLALNSKNIEKGTEIANLYVEGISGFIAEPYSADEVVKLLTSVLEPKSKAESAERQRRALSFLLADSMSQIDELAKQLERGEEPTGYPLKILREISSHLKTAFSTDQAGYERTVMDIFEKAKPFSEKFIRKKTPQYQAKIVHPGSIIRDIMRARSLTTERLAPLFRMEVSHLEMLLNGEGSVDDRLASDLSRVLGRSSREWLKLQKDFDEHSPK